MAGAPFAVHIVPGVASALSYVVGSAAAFPPLVAGNSSAFTIVSVDALGNARVSGGNGSDYLVQLIGISAAAQQFPVQSSATANFSSAWNSTASGNFSLAVQVRSTGANVQGSPFSVQVQPGPTAASACLASGDGYLEGISGLTASFLIAAADAFHNPQWPWLHLDTFLVNISTNGGLSNASTITTTAASLVSGSSVPGVYSVTYPVPSSSGSTYTIGVFLLTSAGHWQAIANSPSLATILPSNTTLSTGLSGPDYPYPQVGRVNQWYIVDTSLSSQSSSLSVLLFSQDGSVQFSGTALQLLPRNYSFAFTPAFHLPLQAGSTVESAPFLVNVSRAGLQSSSGQVNVTFSAGPFAAINCPVLGLPASIGVGAAVAFSVQLFDAYLNRITASLTSGAPNASALCASTPAATAIGSRAVWQSGVWNATDLSYHFSLNLTVACIYTLQVAAPDGSLLSAHTYSLTAQPGPVSARASLVSSASPSAASSSLTTTAGASVSLLLLLNDAFGNPVDPSLAATAPNASVTVTVAEAYGSATRTPNATVGRALYTGQLGRYSVLITPYRATLNASLAAPISVLLAGEVVPSSPSLLNLTVNAAPIAWAQLSGPSTVTAGLPYLLSLSLFDAFNNSAQLTSAAFALTAFVSTPQLASIGLTLGSATTDAMFFATPGPAPSSAFTFIFNSTQSAGAYAFSLRGNGVLVPSASAAFTVLAEAIYVPNTLTSAVLNSSTAGQANVLTLQLRDVYGNVITNASYSGLLSVQLWTWSGTYTCDSSLWSDDTVMPEPALSSSPLVQQPLTVNAVTFSAATSLYSLAYTVFVSGRFTLNVTVAGQPLPCPLLLPALAQNIAPAQPSAATSQVLGVPAQTVAGSPVSVYVDLYDAFGNTAAQGAYAVTVPTSLSAIAASTLPASVVADPSTWLVGALSSAQTDTGGRYTVLATPTRAAVYGVVVALNGVVLSTYSANSTIALSFPASPAVPCHPGAAERCVVRRHPAQRDSGRPIHRPRGAVGRLRQLPLADQPLVPRQPGAAGSDADAVRLHLQRSVRAADSAAHPRAVQRLRGLRPADVGAAAVDGRERVERRGVAAGDGHRGLGRLQLRRQRRHRTRHVRCSQPRRALPLPGRRLRGRPRHVRRRQQRCGHGVPGHSAGPVLRVRHLRGGPRDVPVPLRTDPLCAVHRVRGIADHRVLPRLHGLPGRHCGLRRS